jgi:aminopeptidase-like protein
MIQANEMLLKNSMFSLAKKLFPIHRTLVNRGFSNSLEIVKQDLDIEILEYPSGSEFWDWEVPNAWNVNEAFIADIHGNKLVDFTENNLHLSAYSQAFSGKISKDELLKHLNFIKDYPAAIPYNYLYYNQDRWEFNIAYNTLKYFNDDYFEVHIDVENEPGLLKIGSYYLPGQSEKEILISTYMCHPSMANDNISGVVVAAELFKLLAVQEKLRYSYRLLILPETIGAITWLANHEAIIPDIIGGYVVCTCGDSGNVTYKESYFGNSLLDRIASHVLRHYCQDARIQHFHPSGSDERQYNAPGVRIPVGCLMRSPPGEFKQYHTSLDDLDLISEGALFQTLATLVRIIEVLEENATYKNRYRGEPCFSKYPIVYPEYRLGAEKLKRNIIKILTSELDGKSDLLGIADKWEIPFFDALEVADQFVSFDLVDKSY